MLGTVFNESADTAEHHREPCRILLPHARVRFLHERLRRCSLCGRKRHAAFTIHRYSAGRISDNSIHVIPAAGNASGNNAVTDFEGRHYFTALHHFLPCSDQTANQSVVSETIMVTSSTVHPVICAGAVGSYVPPNPTRPPTR